MAVLEEQTESPVVSPRRGEWVWAALSGIAALAIGLGVAELAAVFISPRSTPIVAAGDTAIELAPRWGKEFAIAVFGVRDKLFLVTVVAVVAVLLAALAGVLEWRRRRVGLAVIALVAVGLGLAAVTRPGADTFAFAPGLLAGVAAMIVLPWLLSRTSGPQAGDTGRRAVVVGGALVVAGASGLLGYVLGGRSRGVETSRADLTLPPPTETAPAVPAAATFDDVEGISPFRVANDDFYRIDTALVVPAVRADEWRLRIHGLVDREFEISLAEVLDRDLVEKWVTLACVSNEVGGNLVGNALFLGLPLAELLEEAGPSADADMVLSTSADGFTAGTPIEAMTDGRGALLAVGMNGEALPVEHGFPARLVIPGLYGYVSATKWVVDLEVTKFSDARAYWIDRGWAVEGPIKISTRIDRPRSNGDTGLSPDGTLTVAGVAWAQDVGVDIVEVRVNSSDGFGEWNEAELADAGTSSTWRQWRWSWTPPGAGDYQLQARATNADGDVQTEDEAESFPDGASGYHTVRVSL